MGRSEFQTGYFYASTVRRWGGFTSSSVLWRLSIELAAVACMEDVLILLHKTKKVARLKDHAASRKSYS